MLKQSALDLPSHGYPDLLAEQAWQDWPASERTQLGINSLDRLTGFLSVAYQASLLNEEGRPVVCRLALCHPSALEAQDLFLYGFHLSRFCKQRPFDEQEIRRLSPAATFYRSIMAVTWSSRNGFTIVGTVGTGQWSRDLVADLEGMIHAIPNWLIIHIRGPGNLVVYRGSERLATLLNGRVEGHGFNVFASSWMAERFWNVRNESKEFGRLGGELDVQVRHDLVDNFDANFFKRVIREIRDRRHGGTLVFGPQPILVDLLDPNGPLSAKYRVDVQASSRPYNMLLDKVLQRLVFLAKLKEKNSIGWLELVQWGEEMPYSISTQYLDLAGWLADMATVDGCLLVDSRFSVLGYGVEIQALGYESETVYRALDSEAEQRIPESAERAGTRHRSAYRLCRDCSQCVVVVISQDGMVQFVANIGGQVTYWNHLNF
jgi:DisA bacterial checkpoint controller nucleotide-binding